MITRMIARRHSRGFSLIEAIIAMVITGILSAMLATFISRPIEGYVAAARRAELSDMADLALKRMALELRSAIPNSMHTGETYIEFIPARGGGRYCTDSTSCTNKLDGFDPKSRSVTSKTFDVVGPRPPVSPGDQIIIFNTGQAGMNAYRDDNCGRVTRVQPTALTYTDRPFPFGSTNSHFYIAPASGPVRFSCNGAQVQRIDGSAPFCGTVPVPSAALLAAADVVRCEFTYDKISSTNGLLTLRMSLTSSNETVSLLHQVHVDNTL